MSIIRVRKNKNYSVISNRHLNDVGLSWKAKGILTYLLSKPDDWTVYVKHLKNQATDGERAVYSGIKELKNRGYLELKQIRDGNRIGAWEYLVIEEPGTETPHEQRKVSTSTFCTSSFPTSTKPPGIVSTQSKQVLKKDDDMGTSPPSFPWGDFQKLMPEGIGMSAQLKALINDRLTGNKNTIGQICESLAYTTRHCSDVEKYKAYFGKTLDSGYGAGFLADKWGKQKEEEIDESEMEKAEQTLMNMDEGERGAIAEQIEGENLWPFTAKREMWENGIMSEKIRHRVLNFLINK